MQKEIYTMHDFHLRWLRIIDLIASICLIIISTTVATAQSAERNAPTPITSNVITGEEDGRAFAHYYSFTAGPGELVMKVDGKTDRYSTGFTVRLFDLDGRRLERIGLVADRLGVQETKRLRLARKQSMLIEVAGGANRLVRNFSYTIRLDGVIELPAALDEAMTPAGTSSETSSTPTTPSSGAPVEPTPGTPVEAPAESTSSTTASGSSGVRLPFRFGEISFPATGKLFIEMKDGTVTELDLRQVQRITIRP
jgi:hypothetical protein